MNRRNLFAWITGLFSAGLAQGQKISIPTIGGGSGKCFVDGAPADCFPIGWQNGKAKNNQCPVCGTIAKPAKWDEDVYELARKEYPNAAANAFYRERFSVTCELCNNDFSQWAEK